MGRTMVGKKQMRVWACDVHVDGLKGVHPVNPGYSKSTER
jgi:hypothetical protein